MKITFLYLLLMKELKSLFPLPEGEFLSLFLSYFSFSFKSD